MTRSVVHTLRSITLFAFAFAAACTMREERPESDTATAGGDTASDRPTRVLTIEGGFQTPESVIHDRDQDVYFVSNINGSPSGKDNNGFIARVRPDGTIDSLRFIAGGRGGVTLNAPKGTAIKGDTLWVADIDALRGFDRRTGAPLATVELGGRNPQFLNDLAVGPDGALYVTDTGIRFAADGSMSAPGPFRVFRVGPEGRAIGVATEGATLGRPNGIAWDASGNRFVLASFGPEGLMGWAPSGSGTTMLATGPGQFDGLAVLDDGRVLASSWADSSVHLLASDSLRRAITGVNAPADIGWDARRNRVLIPLFMDNRVEVWELGRGSR